MKMPWQRYSADPGYEYSEDESKMMNDYAKHVYKKYVFIIACLIGMFLIIGIAVTIGSYGIGFLEAYQIIFEHIIGSISDPDKDFIIFQLRMPRIVAGIIAGAGLAVAGAVMQSTMKNPLADPYTTGISSGASFGATVAIVLHMSVVGGNYAIILNAFIFSLIPMAVIMVVSTIRQASPTTIILSGLAVMYLFNAMTTLLMLMADPNSLEEAFQWQVGTLGLIKWNMIPIMAVVTAAGCIVLQLLSKKINVLVSGDEGAKSLGIDADRLRIVCLVIVSLMAAAIVSFTGIIGFIGLVCPHVCRMFIGSDNKYLIPSSAAFGAMFLILADLVGRTIIAPTVLEVGVITAFIGGPMLLYLLIKKKREVW